MLELLFRSKAEVAILTVVLFQNNLHLREIARRANTSSSQTKRELDILQKIGLLKVEKKGGLSIYSLNEKCLFVDELKGLFTKTTGLIPLLKKRLSKITAIRYCIIYGSYASNKFDEKSDIDILCIGDVDIDKLDKLFFNIQRKIGIETNYIIWSNKDFEKKILEDGAFLKNIKKNKKIFLIGDMIEFIRVTKTKRNNQNRL